MAPAVLAVVNLLAFFPLLASALTSRQDLYALKLFRSSIKPSSIPPWSCLASWNFSTDPCQVPRRQHFVCGVTCSPDQTRVTGITLDSAGYSGQLQPGVFNLSMLASLDLASNNFYGPFPLGIASLNNLQTLVLSFNSFSGVLPESIIADLSSLETLDLSRNYFFGKLPNTFASLRKLLRLDLSYNKFSGSLPALPANLLEIAIKANTLTGSLPAMPFTGLNHLETIDLSENSFSGTVGSWLFLLPGIQQVNLSNNTFKFVDVPKATKDCGLVAIDLGFNRIEGTLPVNFAGYPSLASLSVRQNKLHGTIPSEYTLNKHLTRLYLDGNYLMGLPPKGLFTGGGPATGSLGDNCLKSCPKSSPLCKLSQKSAAICKQAYSGKW